MVDGVTETVNLTKELAAALKLLTKRQVLVGIPENTADVHPDREGTISNAVLGYLFENGSPATNMPARPWLKPGVEAAQGQINARLEGAGRAALAGDASGVEQQLAAAGVDTVSVIKNRITAGIPPPLAQSTVNARRRRSPGSKYRRKATSADDTTPLYDTGNFVASINYVIRDVR